MFNILTTSLALAFASLASAQSVVTVTTTVTNIYTSNGAVYSSTSQYAYPTTASAATAPPAATQTVEVGPNGTLTYNPNNFDAAVGSVVAFKFNPKNHTVTQSNFGSPCVPLNQSTGVEGFSSGFHNTSVPQDFVGFTITINDTKPIWFYCAQKNPVSHCGQGMVGGINTPKTGSNTFDNFLALAKATVSNSSATPSGASSGASGAPGTPTGTGTGATPSGTGTTGTSGNGAISTSLNYGLTAFLAVVGVVVLAL